jgi:RimJ/RimL family protein N-acetyltransferase
MAPEYPGPAYRIVTPRLVIRCWEPRDAPLLKTTVETNIDHLLPWMPWAANYPAPLQEQIELLRGFRGNFDLGKDFVYGVFDPEETRALGGTGLHTRRGETAREIGYWLDKAVTGQGLATELSAALTTVAFEVDRVEWVEIHCAVENAASAAVPRKLGFHHDGTLRRRSLLPDGRYHDSMVWSIFRDEYQAGLGVQVPVKAYDALGWQIV